MNCTVRPSSLHGTLPIPGSKSHTIRAVLLALMAEGRSVISRPLLSRDCMAALRAAESLGARVEQREGEWVVQGAGRALHAPDNFIDADNSGTTAFFVAAIAALCEGGTFLTGDYQIRRRPILPLVEALNALGAEACVTRPGVKAPPVFIRGRLKGGSVRMSGFTSQYISALLLASPGAEGDTEIYVDNPLEKPYLAMTLSWMEKYGVRPEWREDMSYFRVRGGSRYTACDSMVPADWSSVAFPVVAALVSDSRIQIPGVDFEDVQGDKAVIDHLIAMGADIVKDQAGHSLTVRGGRRLKGGLTINLNDIPDSLPALSVAACFAEGETRFTGLSHVRVKETDRVAVMEEELGKMGARVRTTADEMVVTGGPLRGAVVSSHDDHRIAMALICAGLFAEGQTTVLDAECAAVSFTGFFDVMQAAGAALQLAD